MTDKTRADIKGGTLIQYEGKVLQIWFEYESEQYLRKYTQYIKKSMHEKSIKIRNNTRKDQEKYMHKIKNKYMKIRKNILERWK